MYLQSSAFIPDRGGLKKAKLTVYRLAKAGNGNLLISCTVMAFFLPGSMLILRAGPFLVS